MMQVSKAAGASAGAKSSADERVRKMHWAQRAFMRPELGAAAGALLVLGFFMAVAPNSGMFNADGIFNWLTVSAQLGVIAIGASLLMIAGEFDLSIGSMIGFSGMMVAIPAVYWGVPVWLSILFAFAGGIALGLLNGLIVVRTRLPSFIVSLAFLFILRGLTLALSILLTNRTIVSGVADRAKGDWLAPFFGGTVGEPVFVLLANWHLIGQFPDGSPVVPGVPVIVVWWLVLAFVGSFVLTRTQFGNFIFASGGDANAARNLGVPVARVKVLLFGVTAACATLYGVSQVMDFGSAAADRGLQKEFEAIIAAVIGGSLLTGGYGSVVGACFGALIFGVVQQGIYFANWSSDWFRVFLGVMLLMAVLFNKAVRRRVTGER
ncbi:sugar ABC transporter [Aliidongia dinghuensis]|uniref:Xylose transport system permease protein XylH n=1 Tax=Aliidongia dinghuensis TaxID=1867774 RepID=A0A8J3E4A5_9PROT|nr:ABC transporter permease [Aliidongia dinghuensis]GGF25506.1 sugar ABC transporter [Aliidongia dinghuensis]